MDRSSRYSASLAKATTPGCGCPGADHKKRSHVGCYFAVDEPPIDDLRRAACTKAGRPGVRLRHGREQRRTQFHRIRFVFNQMHPLQHGGGIEGLPLGHPQQLSAFFADVVPRMPMGGRELTGSIRQQAINPRTFVDAEGTGLPIQRSWLLSRGLQHTWDGMDALCNPPGNIGFINHTEPIGDGSNDVSRAKHAERSRTVLESFASNLTPSVLAVFFSSSTRFGVRLPYRAAASPRAVSPPSTGGRILQRWVPSMKKSAKPRSESPTLSERHRSKGSRSDSTISSDALRKPVHDPSPM